MTAATILAIRQARPDDRARLIDLQLRASLEHPAYRDHLLARPEVVDLPAGFIADGGVSVGEIDGALIGFSVVLDLGEGLGEIDGLFVEPAHWRRGHGRALLRAGEALLRARGIAEVTVLAAPEAEAFYLSENYRAAGTEQTLFAPAIRMNKRF